MLKYNIYKTFIALFTENKITEIYCLADDFCEEFTKQQENIVRKQSRRAQALKKSNRMSNSEIKVILILFYSGGF